MPTLQHIHIKGFKSIKELDLELRAMNVLIGANGAGKSNFVSFFKMLGEMARGRLQHFVLKAGRSHDLLHFGPRQTEQIQIRLIYSLDETKEHRLRSYSGTLKSGGYDSLYCGDESVGSSSNSSQEFMNFLKESRSPRDPSRVPPATPESRVFWETDPTLGEEFRSVRELITNIQVYQFHDTTPTSRLMQYGYIGDNKTLLHDAGNLAAFLYRLKTEAEPAYRRIVTTIRQVAPFFDDFVLDPTPQRDIMLNWRDKGSDQVFGPHQLSDGTLRAMALISLLLQPEDELPGLLIVDEPELGLHPYAVEVIAALFKMSSLHTQVILCTQSPLFLDHFDPSDVIVVEREGPESTFRRLGETELDLWLERYSLGEIWQKNVIGGGPH